MTGEIQTIERIGNKLHAVAHVEAPHRVINSKC